MVADDRERMHALLCAYVLGEASDEERVEVEAALAKSADLRAERERIEGTIGLVRGALSDGERLPESAVASVLERAKAGPARRPRMRFLRGGLRPVYAAAASLAAIALGLVGYRAWSEPTVETEQKPYLYEIFGKEERQEPRASSEQVEHRMHSVGYGGGEKKSDELLAYAEQSAPAAPTGVDGVLGETLAKSAASARDGLKQQGPQSRLDGAYAGPGDTVAGNGALGGPAAPSSAPVGIVSAGESRQREQPARASIPRVDGHAVARPTTGSAAPAPAEGALRGLGYIGGSGDYFLGRKNEPVVDAKMRAQLRELGYADAGETRAAGERDENSRRFDDDDHAWRFSSLSAEERERYLDRQCGLILDGCRRRPNERPRDMFFRFWGDNAFELAALDPLSTFSADVDTASYALARGYLERGLMPEKAQIRTEEFVNYFKPDVPPPREGTFAIQTELAPSRFGGDANRYLLSVAVRGREVAREERKPLALTFVVDVSGSMKQENRLGLVKDALGLLVAQLDANDAVALVVFSQEARLVLPMTSAGNRGLILSAIEPLQTEGGTNAEAGLKMGYEVALAGLSQNASNRVVLLSDGVANIGQTDQDRIDADVASHRKQGIYLNTVGVGMGNHNDVFLEQLADKGDGICSYVDSPREARRALVENFTGQFEAIARDVKIQVEFDPVQVHRYRLLGYENRAIADQDFRNDAVDAGEIGAGHQVVALYEIERTMSSSERPLATVRVRWKPPFAAGRGAAALQAGEEASEIEKAVPASQAVGFEGASLGYRRAVVAAQFAEILRRSVHAREDSLDDLIAEAEKLEPQVRDVEFTELVALLHRSRKLILESVPRCDDLCRAIDEIRRRNLRETELLELQAEKDQALIDELARENVELERRIRELLRLRLEQRDR